MRASYKFFKGRAAGAEASYSQLQERECSGKYGREYLQENGYSESQIVSDNARDIIGTCINSTRLFLERFGSTATGISATYRWRGDGVFNGQDLVISGGDAAPVARCQLVGRREGTFEVQPNQTIIITCDRLSYNEISPDGVVIRNFPAGLVTLGGIQDSAFIPFEQYSEDVLPIARVENVEQRQARLDADLAGARNSIEELRTLVERPLAVSFGEEVSKPLERREGSSDTNRCPEGMVLRGGLTQRERAGINASGWQELLCSLILVAPVDPDG